MSKKGKDLNGYQKRQRFYLWTTYGLYSLSIILLWAPTITHSFPILFIIGFWLFLLGAIFNIVNAKKYKKILSGEDRSLSSSILLYATHHHWLSRSLFLAMIFYAAIFIAKQANPLWALIVAIAATIWWIYRIGKGVYFFANQKSMTV